MWVWYPTERKSQRNKLTSHQLQSTVRLANWQSE